MTELLDTLNGLYMLAFDGLELLRESGGRVYMARCGDEKYLFKLVKPAFLDTVKQSVSVLRHLERHDFPAPRVILTRAGEPFFTLDAPEGDALCVLLKYIEGAEVEPGQYIEAAGELTGRMHRLMESYDGALTVHGKEFFIDRYIDILRRKGYPADRLSRFIEYGDVLWERVKNLPRGYCHGDLHPGNALLDPDGRLHFLDFDTSCIAFPCYDIMTFCDATDYFKFSPDGYERSRERYERFLTGYETQRALSLDERRAFFDLITVRHYQLQATIIELFGLDCVDERFVDNQLSWLEKWMEQCARNRGE